MTWQSQTINIDVDTGETITKEEKKRNYITLKTRKNVKINESKTIGQITFTNECRRHPQGELDFNRT